MAGVLVAGGAGFLGTHLCRRLLDSGHDVTCMDDLSTGSLENIEALLDNPRFRFIHQDIIAPIDHDAERIYNLACPASPRFYQSDPVRTLKTSVIGSLNLLELARRNGARILLASTSEVYGDARISPQPETYWGNVNPVGVRACYDEGKRCAETLFSDYRRQYGLDTRIARIFNTYGPGMRADDGRVVGTFVAQALAGDPLTVFGDGRQTRSFCHVDDTIDALARVMDASDDAAGPFNIGSPVEIRILDLAAMVLKLTGSRSQVVEKSLPADDPKQRCPDISLMIERFGWQPRTDLETGLSKMIDSYRNAAAHRRRLPDASLTV
ncbi:MAG: SDR family oxidoreductase [Rhizobiaceae bacterium]|nr:SDR family oxidoreductase [Rhizobiaceae bacterium]MCV0405283.1 SDR family oxidoreductase [Rhizobiaceae bacterium]